MFKCPNKNLPEWKELEKVVPEVAYTVWDINDGHGIEKAPNGEPSILFKELLNRFENDRNRAILEKSKMYSTKVQNNLDNYTLDKNGELVIDDLLAVPEVSYNAQDFATFTKEQITYVQLINALQDRIVKGLKDRLSSVKRYSSKNPKTWNQLQTTILQLQNAETELGILLFIEHVKESINESILFLQRPIDQINTKQISQLSKDYVGFYKPLLDLINYAVDTTDLFKSLFPTELEFAQFKDELADVSTRMNTVNNRFLNIRKSKGYQMYSEYAAENGVPQSMINLTINWLDDPKHDSSLFTNWFGMASNSDNGVQLSIAKMLNDVKSKTDRQTLSVGIKLTKTLQKAKDKYGNDVLKLIYERLNDGTFSGYRVKPLNWGQMVKERQLFFDNTAKKLGIEKDENRRYIIPQDESIQNKWYNAINDWYSKHADRKYIPEYYSLRNKMLSAKTREASDEIQNYINNIEDSININNILYENLLTDTEFAQLQQLKKQKSLLSSSYNIDGSEKTGEDAIIAKELQEFNAAVSKNLKYKKDWTRYNKDRDIVAKKYANNPEQLALWEKRNKALRYTDSFYERLDNLEKQEVDPESTHEKLKARRRLILKIYRDNITNKIDVGNLSDAERRDILQLDLDIADSATIVEKQEREEGVDSFGNFAEIGLTEQYYKDMSNARAAGEDAFNEWFNDNHYESGTGFMQAASYYTELRPIESMMEIYSEEAPIGRYTRLDESSEWYNKNWDPAGPSIQPNKAVYDNSKAYNEAMSKPEVKALYEQIEEVLAESNQHISFMTQANDARMPQIPARFMQALSRKDGTLSKIKYAFEDVATTKADDLDFVEEFKTMPNGDPIKIIPTRFIKMLDDTNTISTDAVAAVVQYYNMATNFKNMSEKLDDIELMLDLLKLTQIKTRKEIKTPGSTNVYKQSQLLVDRLMYGRNKTPIIYTVNNKEYNVGKLLDIVRGFVTKVNLSGNIWSIGTSFFTDATYTTLEAKMGRFFDLEDLRFAQAEFGREFPNMMAGIGNANPKGKLPYLLQLNQVVKDNKEIFDRLDQSAVLRSLNQNFWFAGYTQSDYTVKSHTLLSIYHNHRFVKDEGFMSKTEFVSKFYPNDRKRGAVEFKQLKNTLYDAYLVDKNGDVVIDSKYLKYITEKLLNNIRNRTEILSKRIDGIIRDVDRAGIHANSVASYLILHRNFMITMLHDRFKKKQYNMDLNVVEEGYYRTIGNILKDRHLSLKQLIADYDNMQDYEQYAVKKVLHEMLLMAGSTSVALVISSLVDGDDDYDNWFTQATSYLALRSAFEFRTMYNPFEFISLIKSPTAAFNWLDNTSSFLNLINPASYVGDKTPLSIIDRGVYKGMPKIVKNLIKVTPLKNIIEAQDPKAKRSYLQNQLMNF